MSGEPGVSWSALAGNALAPTSRSSTSASAARAAPIRIADDEWVARWCCRGEPAGDGGRKAARYIGSLKDAAKIREREFDRVYERQLLKEQEAEKAEFGETERFVTAAYKKQLQESRKWDAEDARAPPGSPPRRSSAPSAVLRLPSEAPASAHGDPRTAAAHSGKGLLWLLCRALDSRGREQWQRNCTIVVRKMIGGSPPWKNHSSTDMEYEVP